MSPSVGIAPTARTPASNVGVVLMERESAISAGRSAPTTPPTGSSGSPGRLSAAVIWSQRGQPAAWRTRGRDRSNGRHRARHRTPLSGRGRWPRRATWAITARVPSRGLGSPIPRWWAGSPFPPPAGEPADVRRDRRRPCPRRGRGARPGWRARARPVTQWRSAVRRAWTAAPWRPVAWPARARVARRGRALEGDARPVGHGGIVVEQGGGLGRRQVLRTREAGQAAVVVPIPTVERRL